MSLDRMPIYAWAMLVVGGMIIFGFPPVILGTLLLELERAFHWPFFVAAKGGDPVLWQHLFWLFGHPEVYIIFLPAAGMVSMIVPTMARTPLVGYRWIVGALIGVGVLSFGLWVHHMFATGMPHLSAALLLGGEHGGRDPDRHPDLRVDRDAVARHACSARRRRWFLLAFFATFVLGRPDRRHARGACRSTGRRTTPISSSRTCTTC